MMMIWRVVLVLAAVLELGSVMTSEVLFDRYVAPSYVNVKVVSRLAKLRATIELFGALANPPLHVRVKETVSVGVAVRAMLLMRTVLMSS